MTTASRLSEIRSKVENADASPSTMGFISINMPI